MFSALAPNLFFHTANGNRMNFKSWRKVVETRRKEEETVEIWIVKISSAEEEPSNRLEDWEASKDWRDLR